MERLLPVGMGLGAAAGAAYALWFGIAAGAGWLALLMLPVGAAIGAAVALMWALLLQRTSRRWRWLAALPALGFAVLWFGR